MIASDDVLAAALDLPTDERARVAHELLLSLDGDEVGDDLEAGSIAAAWAAEISRRLEEVRNGDVELIDADEADAYVGQRLAELRR